MITKDNVKRLKRGDKVKLYEHDYVAFFEGTVMNSHTSRSMILLRGAVDGSLWVCEPQAFGDDWDEVLAEENEYWEMIATMTTNQEPEEIASELSALAKRFRNTVVGKAIDADHDTRGILDWGE